MISPTTIGKVGSRPDDQPISGQATINTPRHTKGSGSFFTAAPRGFWWCRPRYPLQDSASGAGPLGPTAVGQTSQAHSPLGLRQSHYTHRHH